MFWFSATTALSAAIALAGIACLLVRHTVPAFLQFQRQIQPAQLRHQKNCYQAESRHHADLCATLVAQPCTASRASDQNVCQERSVVWLSSQTTV